MMPVPSYQLIPFLEWLHRRGIRVSTDRRSSEKLVGLALEFLESGQHLPFTTIAGLMSVFQSCPVIQEPTAETQMYHFANCGRCLDMIADRGGHENFSGAVWSFQTELHPLLKGFVEYSKQTRLEEQLERSAHRLGRERFDESDWAFRCTIRDIGDELCKQFYRFLNIQREHNPELISNFEEWRRNRERGHAPDQQIWRRSIDQNTHPLNPNDSPRNVAYRLAESVRSAIEHGFYDEIIAQEPHVARLMFMTMESPENLGQVLEFMNWLRKREPELKIPGTIPSSELEGLALQFCEDNGYTNAKSFSTEARKWLSGVGSERILSRIARFLGLDRRGRMPDGNRNPHNPLDRYGIVRFHGMFLFLSFGDFPAFLDAHWRDLHHLTGDHLDIYFNQSDLRDRTSGYEVAEELRSVEIRAESLPALLLWEDELELAETVPLQGLEHQEIVEVVKSVVQAFQEDATLDEAVQRGAKRSIELRTIGKNGIVVQKGAKLIISNKNEENTYKNVGGVVGAMGDNAVAHDNVFLQDVRKNRSEVSLTPEDSAIVEQLSKALANAQVEQLKNSERMEGAQYLASIAEAATEGQQPEVQLASWNKWLKSLGKRSQSVISVLANVTAIASPIAKLLGFPL